MASLVKFTPISGSHQEHAPSCYLLELDSHKILLDCGLSAPGAQGQFATDETYLRTLRRVARTVDAVLLSHGDLSHCGALPLLLRELGPTVPILATVPVHHLGLMALYDTLQTLEPFHATDSGKRLFGYDEVDGVFERIQTLRYSQSFSLGGSVVVSPLPAGHSLGGSMWRIRKPPAEDILYTSAFNHKKEAHLDGAAFDAISRPSLMVVDARQALAPAVIRKDRDHSLFAALNATFKAGGSVLMPVDSAQRLLEVAYVLDSGWTENVRSASSMRGYLLTNQSYRTVEFAKGMLEWMAQSVMRSFDTDRVNPFNFTHIRLIHSPDEVSTAHPSVILASSETLDLGHSHVLLQLLGRSSANCILAPLETGAGTLLSRLRANPAIAEATVKLWSKVPLEGEELARHHAAQREERERKAAEVAFAAFEKARREQGGDLGGDLTGADDPAVADDDQNFSELLERQIDDVAAFRNIFWVDYRNDWTVRPAVGDPVHLLLTAPDRLADVYMNIGTARSRFQAFPVREITKTIDEYGELVLANEFEAKTSTTGQKTAMEVDGGTVGGAKKGQSASSSRVKDDASSDIPFKWVARDVKVALKCARKFVAGFTGLSDGRSLKTIIARIHPRKLVLVGGSTDATAFLFNHFKYSHEGIETHAPRLLECINVSSSMNLLSGVISESLLNQLRVSYCQGHEVAHLQARVRIAVSGVIEAGTHEEDGADDASDNADIQSSTTYELLPAPLAIVPPCPSVIIGDVKLSELRRFLALRHASVRSEFTASGDLMCNEKVLIRRDQSSGHLVVEGPLCQEYYQIRNAIYENVTMV